LCPASPIEGDIFTYYVSLHAGARKVNDATLQTDNTSFSLTVYLTESSISLIGFNTIC